jgi:hypothetical protein
MSDPKRLLDEGGDDLGVSLLRAGRVVDDEEAKKRSIALFGAATITAAASANATKSGLFQGLVGKWIALGLVTSALVAGLAARALSTPERAVTPSVRGVLAEHPVHNVNAEEKAAASEEAALAPTPREAEVGRVVPGIAIDSLPSATPDEAPLAGRAVESAGKAPSARAGDATSKTSSTLAEEVSSLREAREALAAGQTQRALAALDAYLQRFPGGHLGLEAEELRIEALARSGQGAAASTRARAFLATHPQSPYAHRLRAIAFPNGETPEK